MRDSLPKPQPVWPGETLRILRTIDSFQPNSSEASRQAWQISNRLEKKGVRSPLLTTVSPSNGPSLQKEARDRVRITRVPVQFAVGDYKVSFGMMTYLRQYHLIHCHLYRTFQTDFSFFLR